LRQTIKNTWHVLNEKEKKRFLLLTGSDVIINLFDILFLAALLWLIRFYLQPAYPHENVFLPGLFGEQKSVLPIAAYFFLFSLKNIAAYRLSRLHYTLFSRVAVRLSEQQLRQFQWGRFQEFIYTDSSVFIRKIAFQPVEFCQYILSGIQQIITQSFLILITIAAVILFNAKLFLILLAILLPPVIVIFYWIKKRQVHAKRKIRDSNEKSFQYLLDALKGYVESNIYNRNDFFMNRFSLSRRVFSDALFSSQRLQNLPPRIIEIFAIMGLFILISLAGLSGYADSDLLVTIGAFLAAAYKIIPGAVKIINTNGQMKAYEHSLADLMEPPHAAAEITENPVTAEIHSIEFCNVHFSYPARPVLKNFNLRVQKGEIAGITGPSGKGKTTVLNLLLGFIAPQAGEILINDKSASPDELKQLWPFMAYVRQQTFFIYDTIERNITLEEKTQNKERLAAAIEAAGMNNWLHTLPYGLNTLLTENGKNISGGQQQRISIARALYKNADLILLDEPFNELDEASAHTLAKYFQQLCAAGKIIILITHDASILSHCHKIYTPDGL
jgi:ABC-type bacteriocin/lantibiotic exporter with double-glycine peptidase domain